MSRHCVLKTSHPSPMSAFNGFLTSRKKFLFISLTNRLSNIKIEHFSKCNEYLKSVGKEEIDWSLE